MFVEMRYRSLLKNVKFKQNLTYYMACSSLKLGYF